MTCEDSSYYSMNYYPGFYPTSMMRGSVAQPAGFPATMPAGAHSAGFPATMPAGAQPASFPMAMPSGPSFAVPTVPLGGVREESFIENILRFNKGKIGTFYFTYQGNNKWNAMVYHGRVETAGRDHIIISDPASGKRYLLLMANLDWVEFGEEVNYPLQEISPDVQASLTTSE
ncbi:spore coat protein GerQ [Bacillus sp. V3B]|uniref:spore coat protein GerQ n=1 Tax=Bacillus sp. V3B TaxID=2804915 RepID=UPI00210C84EC|nr:spore coat protein GerQ [Bacillus sp. V3B]MCQ6274741.1 spore coat protein GerQ [Bacillus sp. V3B]